MEGAPPADEKDSADAGKNQILCYNGNKSGILAAGVIAKLKRKGTDLQMETFKTVPPELLEGNVFKLIGKDWMLITAGDAGAFNTMTASWGGLGVLWRHPVATIYIRPQRYTRQFVEKHEHFSLSFFGGGQREALTLCGAKSGRDTDKVKEAGLTPVFSDGTVYFEQAELVLICKKIYSQDLDPSRFLDSSIDANYAAGDYHRMYIGQIVKALTR